MTLYLINKSGSITATDILNFLPTKFGWQMIPGIPIITDSQGTFGMDSRAVYVTDKTDRVLGYAGATYIYGAATVYDVAGTIKRLGNKLGKRVILLRVWHEVLHHYSQDADGISKWLQCKPFLRLLWCISSPERYIGSWVQELFYMHLTDRIDDSFDEMYKNKMRSYRGLMP